MYRYSLAHYPGKSELHARVEAACERFHKKIADLPLEELEISEYIKTYLKSNHSRSKGHTTKLGYILISVLSQLKTPIEEAVVLEYGGGAGLGSLLARELGVGTVLYEDFFDGSCRDAKTIGKYMSLEADAYIHGEIEEVKTYLREHNQPCHAVFSNNVIEHIYDMNAYLRAIGTITSSELSFFFSTCANLYHPVLNRQMRKTQIQRENFDNPTGDDEKANDERRAFLTVRKEIIAGADPSLSDEEVATLAKVTRGRRKDDIEKSIRLYKKTGKMPKGLKHPTNTCDPYTGNWIEHLMNPGALAEILRKEGFDARVLPGYYGGLKMGKMISSTLNMMLRVGGSRALFLAPFFSIHAYRDGTQN